MRWVLLRNLNRSISHKIKYNDEQLQCVPQGMPFREKHLIMSLAYFQRFFKGTQVSNIKIEHCHVPKFSQTERRYLIWHSQFVICGKTTSFLSKNPNVYKKIWLDPNFQENMLMWKEFSLCYSQISCSAFFPERLQEKTQWNHKWIQLGSELNIAGLWSVDLWYRFCSSQIWTN